MPTVARLQQPWWLTSPTAIPPPTRPATASPWRALQLQRVAPTKLRLAVAAGARVHAGARKLYALACTAYNAAKYGRRRAALRNALRDAEPEFEPNREPDCDPVPDCAPTAIPATQ